MWRAALLAGLAATAGILATDTRVAGQEQDRSEYIVFRVDGTHAIATIKVFDTAARQITNGLSPEPAARFGFQSFELPADWRDRVPDGIQPNARWLLQTAPGKTVQATAERIVGGQLGCVDAISVRLGIDAGEAESFSALPARYGCEASNRSRSSKQVCGRRPGFTCSSSSEAASPANNWG